MGQKKANFKKRYKKEEPTKKNPAEIAGDAKEIGSFVAPAFLGYAVGRFAQRITYQIALNRFKNERLAKIAAIGANAAIAYTGYKSKGKDFVKDYAFPLQVGNGLAAAQYATQQLVPKYGWIVSDFNQPKLNTAQAAPNNGTNTVEAAPQVEALPEPQTEADEDVTWSDNWS